MMNLDAEDLLNVKEKWCVVLKTNDGERLKSNLIFNMTTIESADCGHARSRCYTGIWVQALHYLLELEHLNRYVFGFVERTTCWYNGFAYDYDDPSQILKSATCKYESLNCIKQPQASPQATPQGIKKFAYAFRLCLQHSIAQYLPSGYAEICICKFFVPLGYAWGVA
ncbi:hypothetical protein T4D_12746 [Trichinella pseudospiralis]|uniref:Uncharacterized protein n=1 Tax=Trichinella pseudospiralis TaxID=6337 RepID=A0A0V1FVU3_TRIPS|nr:hypothetical protein T4D_12746 [Trichinella pseudospiralis]